MWSMCKFRPFVPGKMLNGWWVLRERWQSRTLLISMQRVSLVGMQHQGKMMRFGAFLGCSGDRIPLASVQNVQPWLPLKLLSRGHDRLVLFGYVQKNCRLSTFVDFLQPKSCSLRHLQETDLARLSRAVRERGSPAKREQCLVTAVKVYICLHEFIPSWPKMDVEYLILNLNIWQVPTTNIALNKPDLRWSVLVEFQPRCWQGPCWLPIGVRSWDEFQGYCWSILIWALSHIRSKSEFQQATKYQQSTLGTPMLIHILCPFCWQPTDYGQLRSLCPRLRSPDTARDSRIDFWWLLMRLPSQYLLGIWSKSSVLKKSGPLAVCPSALSSRRNFHI